MKCLLSNKYFFLQIQPETPFEYLLYSATMMYVLFEIFFILYYGNEIILNSEKLATYLFESKWFEQSPAMQKIIKFLMEILKQPIRLLVGFVVVFPLNLKTFTSVSWIATFVVNELINFFSDPQQIV